MKALMAVAYAATLSIGCQLLLHGLVPNPDWKSVFGLGIICGAVGGWMGNSYEE